MKVKLKYRYPFLQDDTGGKYVLKIKGDGYHKFNAKIVDKAKAFPGEHLTYYLEDTGNGLVLKDEEGYADEVFLNYSHWAILRAIIPCLESKVYSKTKEAMEVIEVSDAS
jgi:hypothetical protein